MTAATLWWMKTNPFNPSNNPSCRTIQTRTGNRILLMLALVSTSLFFVGLENEVWWIGLCFVPCMSIEFRTNKPRDVISALVSIYDSKDLFVEELQVLLAQRLLSITKDNSNRVERQVQFGHLSLILSLWWLTIRRGGTSKFRTFDPETPLYECVKWCLRIWPIPSELMGMYNRKKRYALPKPLFSLGLSNGRIA